MTASPSTESGLRNGALISLQGVSKIFYTDEVETHALAGVVLDINKGDYISIADLRAVASPRSCPSWAFWTRPPREASR